MLSESSCYFAARLQRKVEAQDSDRELCVEKGGDAAELGRQERRAPGDDLWGDEGDQDGGERESVSEHAKSIGINMDSILLDVL